MRQAATVNTRKPPLPAKILALARRFRKTATNAERLLWRLLRNRQVNGHKFRRQYPMGRYVVDFCCHEAKLVVEVDGGGHAEERQEASDARREKVLRQQGFHVLRYWNHDVLVKTEAVLQEIWDSLQNAPSP